MSEAEIRFRMPEGVDIGARLPFPTRSRSTACPFAGHRSVARGACAVARAERRPAASIGTRVGSNRTRLAR
jgi:hypothetical protein